MNKKKITYYGLNARNFRVTILEQCWIVRMAEPFRNFYSKIFLFSKLNIVAQTSYSVVCHHHVDAQEIRAIKKRAKGKCRNIYVEILKKSKDKETTISDKSYDGYLGAQENSELLFLF